MPRLESALRPIDRIWIFLNEETSEIYYRWRLKRQLTGKIGKSGEYIRSLVRAKKEQYDKAITDLDAIALVCIDKGIDVSRILPRKELAEVRSLPKRSPGHASPEPDPSRKREQALFARLSEMLQVPPAPSDTTKMFKGVTHIDLCAAFQHWFNNLQLLFGESVQILILHGLHEEGVDLIIDLMTSQLKFGFQINSHGDVEDKDFQKKVAARANALDERPFKIHQKVAEKLVRRKAAPRVSWIIEKAKYLDAPYTTGETR